MGRGGFRNWEQDANRLGKCPTVLVGGGGGVGWWRGWLWKGGAGGVRGRREAGEAEEAGARASKAQVELGRRGVCGCGYSMRGESCAGLNAHAEHGGL